MPVLIPTPTGQSYPVFPNVLTNPPYSAFRWPIKRTPKFVTLTQTPANLRGQLRISLTTFPIWKFEWDLSYLKGDETPAQYTSALATLLGFYMQVQGAYGNWLFTHPYDNQIPSGTPALALNSVSGGNTGDGTTTVFMTTRQIGAGQDLIQNFNGTPTIYFNGVAQSTGLYNLDGYGNILFNSPPGNGVAVTWSGAFYYLCSFDEDEWTELAEDLWQIWSLHGLKFSTQLL
jgi:hypothetical protein